MKLGINNTMKQINRFVLNNSSAVKWQKLFYFLWFVFSIIPLWILINNEHILHSKNFLKLKITKKYLFF